MSIRVTFSYPTWDSLAGQTLLRGCESLARETTPGRVLSAFRKQPDLNEELHEEVAKSACVILV